MQGRIEQFVRTLAVVGDKLVIESTCSRCGQQLVCDVRVGVLKIEATHRRNCSISPTNLVKVDFGGTARLTTKHS
jgi:hypothetical protein